MKRFVICALVLVAIGVLYRAAYDQNIRPARSFGIFGITNHDDAASTTPPNLEGCYASAADPSDVSADTDAVRAWCLRNGARAVFAVPSAAGGTTPFRRVSTADTNAASVKASAGQLYGVQASNVAAGARFLHVYNTAGTPTCNASIIQSWIIPGNTAGGGTNIPIPASGIPFATGIGICITTANDGTGAPAASDVVVNMQYK